MHRRFLAPSSGSACRIENLICFSLLKRSLERPGQLLRGVGTSPANDYPRETQKPLHPDTKCHLREPAFIERREGIARIPSIATSQLDGPARSAAAHTTHWPKAAHQSLKRID